MIVVCGEALFDVFHEEDTPAGAVLSARIGGSPFNLAVGLARLGTPPMFFGGLSGDRFGRRLRAALEHEGVDLSAAPQPEAKTALVMVSLDADGVPTYGFYGADTADRNVVPNDLARVPLSAEVIHVGSYCMVVDPVAGSLRSLVQRQLGRSVIAYDPNIRLTIEPSVQVWRDTVEWMLPRTTLLKISDEDLHHLYPQQSPADFLRYALERGVQLVVVTLGGDGVIAASAGGAAAELPAVPVKVVDTVGAGDTFQAALLSWLARHGVLHADGLRGLDGATLARVLRFAAGAAAITCSRRGADLPRLAEVRDE